MGRQTKPAALAENCQGSASAQHGQLKSTKCTPRLVCAHALDFRNGSHPEELRTSKTSPLRLPKADVERTCRVGCFGPIVLQKSFEHLGEKH